LDLCCFGNSQLLGGRATHFYEFATGRAEKVAVGIAAIGDTQSIRHSASVISKEPFRKPLIRG
jgi:hypothetical protein